MNTTLLFAELLIIGLQTAVWILLLLINIFGTGWFQTIQTSHLADWQAAIFVVLLSIFYVIGIIIDRVADALFSGWERRLRKVSFPEPPMPIVVLRFELARGNEHLNHQFEYNRTRMRISRASAVNSALATIMGIPYILMHSQASSPNETWTLAFALLIIGAALTLGAAFTWRKLIRGYFGMLKEYSRFMQPKDLKPASVLSTKNRVSTKTQRKNKAEQ